MVTLLTRQQAWRHTHFQTTADAVDAADMPDPDTDGLPNLMESAVDSPPDSPDGAVTEMITNNAALEFNCRRSHAAIADGMEFTVEWSETLANDWSGDGVSHAPVPNTDNGSSVQWKATLPAGNGRRFARLKVQYPSF